MTGLLVTGLAKVDQLMVFHLLGDEASGAYAAAFRFVEPLIVIGVVFSEVYFPRMVRAKASSWFHYVSAIKLVGSILLGGAIFLYLVTSVLVPSLIPLLLGDDYRISANLYSVVALQLLVISVVILVDKILILESLYRFNQYRLVASFLLNIPLNYFFIGLYGVGGSSISTVTA